jgi:hypothetical protein
LKIAILGTRGIPNYHGGFEQFAEFFSVFLYENGHDVYVYNSSLHPYSENTFKGVKLIHCKDFEDKIGTTGQFLYDLNCIINSRKQDFDIILQLGYTSSSIWHRFLPKKAIIITNMDGLEWKRTKYKAPIQKFLRYAERLAANNSDYLVADSIGIQKHLKEFYNKESTYIAYGAHVFDKPNINILKDYNVDAYKYNMLIARIEPENNIEIILDGVTESRSKTPFLVIGKHDANKFGEYLKNKFKNDDRIKFIGGIYNLEHLNNLRYYSNLYFHGHSVGGTNPSLLEAMASHSLIIAHDNIFNKAILNEYAYYFSNINDVKNYIDTLTKHNNFESVKSVVDKIGNLYTWEIISQKYLSLFEKALLNHSNS